MVRVVRPMIADRREMLRPCRGSGEICFDEVVGLVICCWLALDGVGVGGWSVCADSAGRGVEGSGLDLTGIASGGVIVVESKGAEGGTASFGRMIGVGAVFP